jgi:hypothetical protein
MSDWAPERIWLQRGVGEEGSHTWCEDEQGGDIEEAEYVRTDRLRLTLGMRELLERAGVDEGQVNNLWRLLVLNMLAENR